MARRIRLGGTGGMVPGRSVVPGRQQPQVPVTAVQGNVRGVPSGAMGTGGTGGMQQGGPMLYKPTMTAPVQGGGPGPGMPTYAPVPPRDQINQPAIMPSRGGGGMRYGFNPVQQRPVVGGVQNPYSDMLQQRINAVRNNVAMRRANRISRRKPYMF